MLAINWFEVILPSFSFDIYSEPPPPVKTSRRRRIDYRSVVKNDKLFHITSSKVETAQIDKIDVLQFPTLASYAIEHGFAKRLATAGFEISFKHVGGFGVKSKSTAHEFQDVFTTKDGLAFRCYFGFGDSESRRWGLILRYINTHKFLYSLEEPSMRKLALGRRVIPFSQEIFDDERVPYSGIYTEQINNATGRLINDDGKNITINLSEWTLPCSPENLSSYIRLARGAEKVGKAAIQLQKESLALNENGRINNNYARDHLLIVQDFLNKYDLPVFSLPFVGSPLVTLITEPLTIGN